MKIQSLAALPGIPVQSTISCIDPLKVYAAIVDVVFAIDGKGIFQFVSPSCFQLFGYRAEEMTGASFLNFINPDDIEKTVQLVRERTHDCKTSNFENRYYHKNGTLIPITWSGRWDETDQLLYCVARDGSEKQVMEQRLHKAQQVAKLASYEFDVVNNCYTYTSDTIFELFGLDRQLYSTFTPELFWRLLHPDDVALVKGSVHQPEHFLSSTLQYRIIRPNGEVVYINRIREVVLDAGGKPLKNIGMLQDITERKIGELALQQREERFRSLVQHGSDLIGILDAQGTYIFVGDNVQEQLGYERDELKGKNALQYIHPDDAEMIGTALQKLMREKTISVGPYRFRNRQGEWRWVETTASNHLDNPVIGGLICNSRDVTDKKKQDDENRMFQQKIEEQNQMMVEVLEQMRDGFLTVTLEGTIIYWNAEAERISGMCKEKALGNRLWDLYPGIEQTPYYSVYEQLLVSPEPVQEVVYSPFHLSWVELRAYRTQRGISVFFRDITKQITAEEELRKLSLIASETNNPVIVQDAERKVKWVNRAFTDLSGYRFEECLGKFIGDICDGPETDIETLRYVREKIKLGEPFRIEAQNYKKNGEIYWSDVSCQPILDEKGEVVQYFSIATDITERKQLEKKLIKQQREQQIRVAAATLKAQEHERSVVSQELHDNVNQVLTTVKLYTEMCRDGIGNAKAIMDKSIRLLQESINEIRSLSKRLSAPSLGKIKLAESVKELIIAVGATDKFKITGDTSAIDNLEVNQDVHLAVYRILQEHLTNILKHAAASRVDVSLDVMMGYIHLRIRDNGKGFDTGKKTNGIGIQNMITRAESLKGTFTLTSAPDKGCIVTVSIPLAD